MTMTVELLFTLDFLINILDPDTKKQNHLKDKTFLNEFLCRSPFTLPGLKQNTID
jgi:hypothetical protein